MPFQASDPPRHQNPLSQGGAICNKPVMREKIIRAAIAASLGLPVPLIPAVGFAQDKVAAAKPVYPSPSEIVAAAKAEEWAAIAPSDLLVMDIAPDAKGRPRRVVIQLMPAPFSQGWVGNIRKLAAAKWWDGTSVNRVQDNYVVQWGDASEKKALLEGLRVMGEAEYVATDLVAIPDPRGRPRINYGLAAAMTRNAMIAANGSVVVPPALKEALQSGKRPENIETPEMGDAYAHFTTVALGWPIAATIGKEGDAFWPVHCYGMVGVGRNLSPDTGTGAELYTVIGHAPRHLDRNIALVGRVIEGIEHLSSLPRGGGALGFYEKEEERVPILSVRMGHEIADLPAFEYLYTESETFAKYAEARANRRDPFFNVPAGGADICNIPVPVRRKG